MFLAKFAKKSSAMAKYALVVCVAVFVIVILGIALELRANEDDFRGETIPFAETAIFFEQNATDGDIGIQFFADGEPWKYIKIIGPRGCGVLAKVNVGGSVRKIGLTEIFSESAEPGFDELPLEKFLALFPEGEYKYIGKSLEGDKLVGTATLTHNLPDAPVILSPEEDEVVNPNNLVIIWNAVPDPNPPNSVITGYHVVVERDEEGQPPLSFTVDLPSTATNVSVPPEFFEPGTDYKVEILAIETSGNRTITEVPFSTAE